MILSPKRPGLERVECMRKKWEAAGVMFFLVGGHVSLDRQLLEEDADSRWACFMTASGANHSVLERLPTLDNIGDKLVAHLQGN
jgi:hypothetical protein